MRLLLVDDEPPARAKLRRLLADLPGVEVVGEAGDAEEALSVLAQTPADAALLDIQMPGMSGLALAATLPPSVLVAFTTAYDAFAVQAFELNAVDYLLKPFTRERLHACVERLRQRLAPGARERQRQGLLAALHSLQPMPGHWMVSHRGALHRIAMADIEAVEAADNYVELHTARESWLDRVTLAAFLAHPAAGSFVQVHRSFAVNVGRIARIAPLAKGDAELTMESGRTVRVSRRYREGLMKHQGLVPPTRSP
ncbi:MAG TPA: LytTR family DNA-binding domain-containing protein [Albitalea sp.]|uniref:LytR/AlgR family response regulator transcription factor n=1 Tax=Piscinibacter sp. TaxID=1903157 RepID=UPI002ED3B93D